MLIKDLSEAMRGMTFRADYETDRQPHLVALRAASLLVMSSSPNAGLGWATIYASIQAVEAEGTANLQVHTAWP
jgi:hypothetical protein